MSKPKNKNSLAAASDQKPETCSSTVQTSTLTRQLGRGTPHPPRLKLTWAFILHLKCIRYKRGSTFEHLLPYSHFCYCFKVVWELWYFPGSASSLDFVKSTLCGQKYVDTSRMCDAMSVNLLLTASLLWFRSLLQMLNLLRGHQVLQSSSSSSQRCWRSGLCVDQSSSSTANWENWLSGRALAVKIRIFIITRY